MWGQFRVSSHDENVCPVYMTFIWTYNFKTCLIIQTLQNIWYNFYYASIFLRWNVKKTYLMRKIANIVAFSSTKPYTEKYRTFQVSQSTKGSNVTPGQTRESLCLGITLLSCMIKRSPDLTFVYPLIDWLLYCYCRFRIFYHQLLIYNKQYIILFRFSNIFHPKSVGFFDEKMGVNEISQDPNLIGWSISDQQC